MKYLKPLMFVIAGFVVAMLVSFKTEEPKKEYATIVFRRLNSELVVIYPNNSEKSVNCKLNDYDKDVHKIINEMASNGWEEKIAIGEAYIIHMERIKQ